MLLLLLKLSSIAVAISVGCIYDVGIVVVAASGVVFLIICDGVHVGDVAVIYGVVVVCIVVVIVDCRHKQQHQQKQQQQCHQHHKQQQQQ